MVNSPIRWTVAVNLSTLIASPTTKGRCTRIITPEATLLSVPCSARPTASAMPPSAAMMLVVSTPNWLSTVTSTTAHSAYLTMLDRKLAMVGSNLEDLDSARSAQRDSTLAISRPITSTAKAPMICMIFACNHSMMLVTKLRSTPGVSARGVGV